MNKTSSFSLLESFGLTNGKYHLYNNHLERLQKSALHFDYDLNLVSIEDKLESVRKKHSIDQWKVRLLAHKDSTFNINVESIKPLPNNLKVSIANSPVNRAELFLHHKTTNRLIYEYHKQEAKDVFDVLLWNEEEELTEFTIGNLVVEMNGTYYTPSITSGLLNGTLRKELLSQNKILEKQLYLSDLKSYERIWLINSVRGWISVSVV